VFEEVEEHPTIEEYQHHIPYKADFLGIGRENEV
jgi:hypothetical protein